MQLALSNKNVLEGLYELLLSQKDWYWHFYAKMWFIMKRSSWLSHQIVLFEDIRVIVDFVFYLLSYFGLILKGIEKVVSFMLVMP